MINYFYASVAAVAFFVMGLFSGVHYAAPYYQGKVVEQPAKVVETVKHDMQTTIQYVPKEIIVYRDPVTGLEVSRPEDTDVEAAINKPSVNVKVNGQPYKFSLLQNEEQKFELGKVLLEQNSEIGISLEIKPQIIDRAKSGGIDVIGGKYSGIGIRYKRLGMDFTMNTRDSSDKMVQARWTVVQW